MTQAEALQTVNPNAPLLTPEQQEYCDQLLAFAGHCGSISRAAKRGVAPLLVGQFIHAVVFNMPEKTDAEKLYLITYAKNYLGTC